MLPCYSTLAPRMRTRKLKIYCKIYDSVLHIFVHSSFFLKEGEMRSEVLWQDHRASCKLTWKSIFLKRNSLNSSPGWQRDALAIFPCPWNWFFSLRTNLHVQIVYTRFQLATVIVGTEIVTKCEKNVSRATLFMTCWSAAALAKRNKPAPLHCKIVFYFVFQNILISACALKNLERL